MKTNLLVLFFFLIYIPSLHSQKKTDANIIGHVTSGGEHVHFATVSIPGTTVGTSTDETGHFQLINMPLGKHIIRAYSIGYKAVEKEVVLKAGETIELNFELDPDMLGLDEIVVTADRGEIKRVESASIVNTLSPKLFTSTQSVTLSEGLNFSPGLRMENNCQNCGFSQVRMNGMEGPYSQILINSRPIFSGLAGVYGLELIPANMIEKVEVVRGGGSAIYGSNAIAGTINIILKEPESSTYEAGFNSNFTGVGVSGSGGAAPDYSANFNTSIVSADSKTGFSLIGFTRKRDIFDANNDGYSELSQLSSITLGTTIYHKFGLRNKLSVDFYNINEARDGGNRLDYTVHERDIAESLKHDIKAGAVTFEQYFRGYDLLSVYFSTQLLDRDSYYGANRTLSSYGKSKDITYNIGFQYKAVFDKSTLIGGIENTSGALKDYKMGYPDYQNAVINNDTITSVPHTDNTIIADQKTGTTGLFLQYDLKMNRLKLGFGGRFEHFAITDNFNPAGNNSGNVISPRINIMYEVAKPLQARVSYSQGYRAPQIFNEDLHIEASGSRKIIIVNDPGLKQEKSHSVMASLDFNRLLGTVNTGFLAEFFYTRLTDAFVNEIGSPDEEGTVYYTRMNAPGGATVSGLNMELRLKPLTQFSVTGGFTIQKSTYDEPQRFSEKIFFRTPADYGFLIADWDFTDNFCLSSSFNYTGKMLVPYFGPNTDPVTGELRKSESFFDLGLKISHTVKINGASVQWYAGMKNIFNSYQSDFDSGVNRDPSYIYGPVSPRTIYLGIRFGNMLN
ncbi:MAG: TonB-dependent receptor [Bacteroidales bacterium]|nr:TonB-dependent receptor [Bacteroidales bacterium]MBK7628628.1 TonB-dependent receptor [Bacteroidales bacterium]